MLDVIDEDYLFLCFNLLYKLYAVDMRKRLIHWYLEHLVFSLTTYRNTSLHSFFSINSYTEFSTLLFAFIITFIQPLPRIYEDLHIIELVHNNSSNVLFVILRIDTKGKMNFEDSSVFVARFLVDNIHID